jgi:hypothetical protein
MTTPAAGLTEETVEIRPTSDVFATYRRLSYKPWFAVAEFVDNSTQSFYDNEVALGAGEAQLEIRIYHDKSKKRLTVADNAYGMTLPDFKRAIQLNSPPSGKKTRNEFGMGLKTAACWMGAKWTVRSKALGSSVEYSATVDVDALAKHAPDKLPITLTHGLDPDDHYSVVQIDDMYRVFQTKTTGRIKELLGSMYRRDLATGRIAIYWNDDLLAWDDAPLFKESLPDGSSLTWRADVSGELPNGLTVSGWAGIRLPGSARLAGLHLFRENRIVVGGPSQGWKPYDIYGAPNSFASQRIVGEIDLNGWPVTQAKDGFDWDGGLEDDLVSLLHPQLQGLIDKASGSLKDPNDQSGPEPSSADATLAVDTIAGEVASEVVGSTVTFFDEEPLVAEASSEDQQKLVDDVVATGLKPTLTAIGHAGVPTVQWWLLDKEHPLEPFMQIASPTQEEMHVFVNLRHPFVEEHVGADQTKLVLYLKFLLADALVDRAVSRRSEPTSMASMRKFKDSFLRNLPSGLG